LRQWTKTIIAVPHLNDGIAATWEDGHLIFRHLGFSLKVLVHELGHSMDFHGLSSTGYSPFSDSPTWRDAWKADKAIVSDYAATNFVENLAESGVVGIYGMFSHMAVWSQYKVKKKKKKKKENANQFCSTQIGLYLVVSRLSTRTT
jgi:hypothetical protein